MRRDVRAASKATTTPEGVRVLCVQLDPERLAPRTADLARRISDRSAGHALTLSADGPAYGLVAYEPEVVRAELAVAGGYLAGLPPLPDRPTVLDVGAHTGLFAAQLLRRRPAARVVAVEPFVPSRNVLRRNLDLHGARSPVVVDAALGDGPGRSTIRGCAGASTLAATRSGVREPESAVLRGTEELLGRRLPRLLARGAWPAALGREVAARVVGELFAPLTYATRLDTVSNVLAALGRPEVDLLKVDVENDELRVLRGIRPADWPLVAAVVLETTRADLAGITALLHANGLESGVRPVATLSGAFGGDCVLVHARRRDRGAAAGGTGAAGAPSADPLPSAPDPAVAELAAVLTDLAGAAGRRWPGEPCLVDVRLAGGLAPLSQPWLERDHAAALRYGPAWAGHLVGAYAGGRGRDPESLTRTFGGGWRAYRTLFDRYRVADVVAARLAAEQYVRAAVLAGQDTSTTRDVRRPRPAAAAKPSTAAGPSGGPDRTRR